MRRLPFVFVTAAGAFHPCFTVNLPSLACRQGLARASGYATRVASLTAALIPRAVRLP